jgi:hypothetical protein
MRCSFCGTGLAHDATRCWLCHAGVEPGAPADGPADLDFLPHPAHIWTGQRSAASPPREPRGARRPGTPRWRDGVLTFRGEIRLFVTLLALLAAILPYAATGSRTILVAFGVPFALVAMWSLKHIWRRARLG